MDESYSVVIPAYNAAATIADAIRSLLAQTVPPSEIIVVDDGSTDDTGARAAAIDPIVRVIRQVNRGAGAATNAGIAAHRAPFLAFLDSDDVWLPHKARTQRDRLRDAPHLAGVFGKAHVFKGDVGNPILGPLTDIWGRSSLFMRAEAATRIGPMVEDMPGNTGELIDWIARGRDLGLAFTLEDDIVAMRRIRPDSLSYTRDAEKDRGYLLAVKRALDRKRAASTLQSGGGHEPP